MIEESAAYNIDAYYILSERRRRGRHLDRERRRRTRLSVYVFHVKHILWGKPKGLLVNFGDAKLYGSIKYDGYIRM